MPPISLTNEEASVITAIVIGLVTVWKLFFRGKKELREDKAGAREEKAGTREEKANEDIYGGYKTLLDRLERKIDDQDQFIHQLGKQFETETEKRRDCERKNHALELRIIHLELVVIDLGGKV